MPSPKSLNPSSIRLGPPFICQRGRHSGTQEVERYKVAKFILWHRRTNAFNALPTCPLCFIGDDKEARPGCRCLVWLRVRADEALVCHVGWLLCWRGGGVFRKICMPPHRCLLSWCRGRVLTRRCMLSWSSWQLHGSGGGVLVGVGLAAAPQASSSRALPGARQGSSRGTAVVVLRTAPCAATIFPKHPHVDGGIAVKLEV